MISIQSKIKGALYGFAIGDAMGATTEFMGKEAIKRMYGTVDEIMGGGWLNLPKGQVTDDTEMTLCVCEAIEEWPRHTEMMLDLCCENFKAWYLGGPRDIGGCCRRVISTFIRRVSTHEDWIEQADNPDSLGNGSLMRTMPIVLSGLSHHAALLQGRLTHNNKTCDTVIHDYYLVLRDILEGTDMQFAPKHMDPTGHVVNTYENSIYWFATTDSFKDAIVGAVNDGGDADTIAAITGSLAGAYYGFEEIPKLWIDQLDSKVKLKLDKYAKLFEKLYSKVCTK